MGSGGSRRYGDDDDHDHHDHRFDVEYKDPNTNRRFMMHKKLSYGKIDATSYLEACVKQAFKDYGRDFTSNNVSKCIKEKVHAESVRHTEEAKRNAVMPTLIYLLIVIAFLTGAAYLVYKKFLIRKDQIAVNGQMQQGVGTIPPAVQVQQYSQVGSAQPSRTIFYAGPSATGQYPGVPQQVLVHTPQYPPQA